jgi:hypothetical protein
VRAHILEPSRRYVSKASSTARARTCSGRNGIPKPRPPGQVPSYISLASSPAFPPDRSSPVLLTGYIRQSAVCIAAQSGLVLWPLVPFFLSSFFTPPALVRPYLSPEITPCGEITVRLGGRERDMRCVVACFLAPVTHVDRKEMRTQQIGR